MAKCVSVEEAVAAIPDGATVALDGFTMMGVAEAVAEEIERSFFARGHPRDLVLVHSAGQSNREQGFEHFAHPGLAKRVVGSHWGLMPRMSAFLAADGYHHHVAINVWRGVGVPAAPPATVGLRHWNVVYETPQALAEVLGRIEQAGIPTERRDGGVLVRDPWDIALLLTARDPA
jgi:hypothetical protein